MLQVGSGPESLERYQGLLDESLYQSVCSMASSLRGLRVLHVNATPAGGGVAEILRSLVPLMNDAGLRTSWCVIDPDPLFFSVTKKLHNGLQGKSTSLAVEEFDSYWSHNRRLAERIAVEIGSADVVIVHDPQVLPLAAFLNTSAYLVWQPDRGEHAGLRHAGAPGGTRESLPASHRPPKR